MEKVIFYHGGPGMNGNPERALLTAKFSDANFDLSCWDEPSNLRPDKFPFDPINSFENYKLSAAQFLEQEALNQKVIVILFCFGCNLAKHLYSLYKDKIKLFVIITPDFHQDKADFNIFNLIKDDFYQHDSEQAKQMEHIIKNYTGKFDANAKRGWELAVSNPRLFNYYWQSDHFAKRYTHYYSGNYSIDPESFFAVRDSLTCNFDFKCDLKTLVFYGKHERLTSVSDELKLLSQIFTNVQIIEMVNSAHYPYIEEMELFLKILSDDTRNDKDRQSDKKLVKE